MNLEQAKTPNDEAVLTVKSGDSVLIRFESRDGVREYELSTRGATLVFSEPDDDVAIIFSPSKTTAVIGTNVISKA